MLIRQEAQDLQGEIDFWRINVGGDELYSEYPVTVPVGTLWVTGHTKCTPMHSESLWLKMKTWFVDPGGIIKGFRETQWWENPGDWSVFPSTSPVTIDQPGTWALHGEFWGQVKRNGPEEPGILLAQGNWPAVIAEDVGHVGGIKGKVVDGITGKAISGVLVKSGPYETTTSWNGLYVLGDIPIGNYTFYYTRSGYSPSQREVTITTGDWVNLDVVLMPYENGNGNGNGNGEEGEGVLKYALIGGGIIFVAAVLRSALKRGGK